MVPVAVTPVAARGVATAAAATGLLATESRAAATSSLELAGAQAAVASAADKSTASLLGAGTATARLDAALLGLRTAVGSTAVIGLGALALAAIAAGKAISASIKNFAQFQQELAVFRVTAGATADQMQAVREAATRLGADVRLPAVSAADAAVAMTELAKAGLSVEDSIAGAEGVLQLATAAQISNAEASQIAANALNSFGLAGDQAVRVADDLANAANAAQGSISDFGFAFAQASAVARQVGLSLEDTTSLLALLAKNGLQGSDAGTSLRVALIRLVAPTKQAQEEIRKLGINIRDAQGNVRADVFAQFGNATRDLGPAARDAAAALIFGQDAIRAVAIASREGTQGLTLMQFQIDQTGTAAELAAARTEGLGGKFAALSSEAETLSVQVGALISGPLGGFIDSLSLLASGTTIAIEKLGDLGDKFDQLAQTIPGGGATNDFLGQFQKLALTKSPLTATVDLLQRLGVGSDEAAAKLGKLNDELKNLQDARILAQKAVIAGDPGAVAVVDTLTKRIKAQREEIESLKKSAAGISTSLTKPIDDAVASLEKLRDVRVGEGLDPAPIDRLIQSLRASIPAAREANRENANMVRGMDGVKSAALGAAGGVDTFSAALKGLNAASFSANSALLKLQNEGASPQAQISNLQQQRRIQEQRIAEIKRDGNQAGDATQINAAREEINRIQAQIDSLLAGIASDAKAAATSAERAAKDAQDARDKQFQAIADAFGGRQGNIENQIARAGIAGNIQKQINLTKALVASLKKERDALLDRLKTLKVSNEVRKRIMQAITAAIESARQDILRLNKEQADRLADFSTPAIDIRIRIAQARDNVAQEIRLRRQRLALITKELVKLKNAGKKNTLAWLELKAQQAEEAAAIRDLEKQTKDKNDATKSAFFTFLQSQQGFAANLLGNLIPGFATRGLVGGSSDAAASNLGLGRQNQGGGFEEPRGGVASQAALASSRERGVRPVQVDTTNSLLRQILAALQGRQSKPPEATFNYAAARASYDTMDHGW